MKAPQNILDVLGFSKDELVAWLAQGDETERARLAELTDTLVRARASAKLRPGNGGATSHGSRHRPPPRVAWQAIAHR